MKIQEYIDWGTFIFSCLIVFIMMLISFFKSESMPVGSLIFTLLFVVIGFSFYMRIKINNRVEERIVEAVIPYESNHFDAPKRGTIKMVFKVDNTPMTDYMIRKTIQDIVNSLFDPSPVIIQYELQKRGITIEMRSFEKFD